jgi:hypothetical protein
MKISNLLVLVPLLLITACATAPTPITDADPTPLERVYFQDAVDVPTATAIFVSDLVLLPMLADLHLLINGAKAASIAPSEKVSLKLPAGAYVFSVYNTRIFGADVQDRLEQKLDAGRTYLYRVYVSDRAGPRIQRVIEESGE